MSPARTSKSSNSAQKAFIVCIVLEKPRSYLYDRLRKNLNPFEAVFFFDEVNQAEESDTTKKKVRLPPGQYIRHGRSIDDVFYEASRAAADLQLTKSSITVIEIEGSEEDRIRTGPA